MFDGTPRSDTSEIRNRLTPVTIQQTFQRAQEHHQSMRLAEAEGLYRQILAIEPHHAEALHYLGVLAYQVNRHDLAIDLIRQALALHPDSPAAHSNLGEAYRSAGRLEEAIASFRRALQLNPNHPEAHFNLGNALKDRGQLDDAVAAYHRGLEIRPNYPGALNNLGNALKELGELEKAVAVYRRTLQLKPDFPEAHNNLGNALAAQHQFDEAIAAFRGALQLRPDYPEAHNNLGTTFAELDQFDNAIAAYRRALQLKPDYAPAHYNLGTAQRARGQFDEAVAAYRRSLQIKPDSAETYNNLGTALKETGELAPALAAFRQAVDLKPADPMFLSNLIYSMQFGPAGDEDSIRDEQVRWNRLYVEPFRPSWRPCDNVPDPRRRLRIGYVSPTFHSNAVAFFLAPLLESHDHGSFDVYCYASVRRPDAVTDRLRKSADVWRDVRALSDAELAERVRDDGIDILVDLSMHTGHNRLPAFARRPAPVQVSWLAYPGTTGVAAIDYRLTDARIDPPDREDDGLGGQVVRLPDAWCCYAPIEEFPSVGPLPAAQDGIVTFGSLNQFSKVHEGLLHCWARLLEAVPDSRLLAVCPEGQARERTHALFATHGIARERVEFVALCPWPDYVRLFQRIDLALDAFPHNGMTTTCHTLWMGVPVVTLAGTSAVSHASRSLLHTIGLPEWVAPGEEQYIRIATEWAADLPRLAELRGTLRARMEASPLMDAPRFARNMEAVYRTMWQAWCTRQPVHV